MSNIAGFKFEITSSVRQVMDALNAEANSAIAQALRHAIRPMRDILKTEVRELTHASSQSSGATLRSIVSKAGRGKKNKNLFYAYTGVSRKVREVHYLNEFVDRKGAAKHKKFSGRSMLKDRSFRAEQTKTKWNTRKKSWNVKTKTVNSFLRTSSTYRINRQRGFIVRRPQNYWHLIDKGFRHFSGKVVEGYHFINSAYMVSESTIVNSFKQHLQISLTQATIRVINRKVRTANK